MSDLRLRRRHRNARGVAVKRGFQSTGLDAIVEDGRGAVQVNVVNVLWLAASILERQTHRARRFIAVFSQTNAMICIASSAVAGYLRVNLRAAIGRVFEVLEDVNPRAFAKHDSGSIAREG